VSSTISKDSVRTAAASAASTKQLSQHSGGRKLSSGSLAASIKRSEHSSSGGSRKLSSVSSDSGKSSALGCAPLPLLAAPSGKHEKSFNFNMLLQYQFISLLVLSGRFCYFRMGNDFIVLKIYHTVTENVENVEYFANYISIATAKTVTNVVQVKGTVRPKLASFVRSSLKREARRFLEKS
jgi:hypothetical protein